MTGEAKKAFIIAVAGKGGTGKTIITSLVLKLLTEQGRGRVLAIDADPATSLPSALGVRIQKTIGDVREEIASPSQVFFSETMPTDMLIEYTLDEILVHTPRFSLLAMGRSEGPGCYCLINDMLRHFIDKLSARFSTVLIDCEAGLEHLSRRTTRDVDTLLVVSDPTKRGIETARAIKILAEKLQINVRQIYLVVNKVTEDEDVQNALPGLIADSGLTLIGVVPEDEQIRAYDLVGKPIIELPDDSKAVIAVKEIFGKLYKIRLCREELI
ncbi:MAG: ATP-binding protein [Methanophagales archaeon ANME-1-THS]|nr:MAG: ATP-binding protein [Methanophagales archaeon ANME-1-THS]